MPELNEHDPFLLRAYEPAVGITLDLLAGAFEKEQEARELASHLETEGLGRPETVSWVDVEAAAAAYDALSVIERTEFLPPDPAWDAIPAELGPLLQTDLIPPGYRVSELVIMNQADPATYPRSPSFSLSLPHTSAGWSIRVVLEQLLGTDTVHLEGFVFHEHDGAFSWPAEEDISFPADATEERSWQQTGRRLLGQFVRTDHGDAWWYGVDQKHRHAWAVWGAHAGVESLIAGEGIGSLLSSDTIVKTLALLPESEDATLWAYRFSIVEEEYARSRNYADWARKMVGHWLGTTVISTMSDPIMISAFDLVLAREAEENHRLFAEQWENRVRLGLDMRGSELLYVAKQPAVYVHRTTSRYDEFELSFAQGSFIIALGAQHEGTHNRDSMEEWAKRLRIWDDGF